MTRHPSRKQQDLNPNSRDVMKIPRAMFYRRRILLAILAYGGGYMEKMRLQKLLFLFTQQQGKPAYYFLPYKYGCYSFQVDEDARILANHYNLLTTDEQHYALNNTVEKEEIFTLKNEDHDRLKGLIRRYRSFGKNRLLYLTYERYPYYAVNSELLNCSYFKPLRETIKQERAKLKADGDQYCLYTIGYEGISIEQYINRLMKNGISMLIDVRYNSFSMKYGFSKGQLEHITNECGIEYLHTPELGIEGSQRKDLGSRADYDRLFTRYRQSLLKKEKELQLIQSVLNKHSRIALTCFEKNHEWCHRKFLAEAIHTQCGITTKHL